MMTAVINLINWAQDILEKLVEALGFIGPLLLRLYLVPIFWIAGTKKIGSMESTIEWFGNTEWGLGLPFPTLMAWAASLTEAGGAILLLFGLGVRWISIPLMGTMVVAALTVHLQNGWLAIAEGAGFFATERTIGAIDRLDRAKDILKEHGNYSWLTENGPLVMLNNGIEFAATYFIMLLALLVIGAGKYASLDYWIAKKFRA
jgi:putative oxidoreductase